MTFNSFPPKLKADAGCLIGALQAGSVVLGLQDNVAMKLALNVLRLIIENYFVYSVLMCHSFMGRTKIRWGNSDLQVWTHDRAFQTNNLTT